jgi:hypothetical protein
VDSLMSCEFCPLLAGQVLMIDFVLSCLLSGMSILSNVTRYDRANASVALVVLFGDTLSVIFPSVSSNTFKAIGFIM